MDNTYLDKLVDDYLKRFGPGLDREICFFRDQPSLAESINKAAMAQCPQGKCYHQRRVPCGALEQSKRQLAPAKRSISECSTFDELHKLVNKLIGSIRGIGELTVYDTSLRIGAKLGLEPEVVYLHAGTRKGANAFLKFSPYHPSISVHELPEPLQQLRPCHVENLLCIYKDVLGNPDDEQLPLRGCSPPIHPC